MQTAYTVICSKCSRERNIVICDTPIGKRIDWLDDRPDDNTIISGRERSDGQFGWQCMCGNNDLLTTQERTVIKNPANPSPKEMNEIIRDLKPDKSKFIMREATV